MGGGSIGLYDTMSCPELPKLVNYGMCLKSCRDSSYGLGYIPQSGLLEALGLGRTAVPVGLPGSRRPSGSGRTR